MKIDIAIPPSAPRLKNWLTQNLCGFLFKALGWRIRGTFPDVKKAVIIVAPHTSNWDYIIAMLGIRYLSVRVRYLMKSELDVWPAKYMFRGLGGIPVQRGEKTDIVQQCIDKFNEAETLWLGLAPEGTRHKTKTWKTGFLRIAKGANVPIILVGIDGANKTLVIDKIVDLEGDFEQQAQTLKDYTAEKFTGIKPQNR